MLKQNETTKKSTYSEVRKNQLSPASLNTPYETDLTHTLHDTPQDLHETSLLLTRMLAELRQVEPSKRLQASVQLGSEMILSALQGTPDIPNVGDMRVVFLAPGDYEKLRKNERSGGVMIPGINEVFVKIDPQDPDFFTASKAFHELVHRWIDIQHHVFYSEVDEANDIRKTFFEIRRVGLTIVRIVRDTLTGKVSHSEFLGELINELGNFAWQSIFLEQIQSDPTMRTLFADEFSFRDSKLFDLFGDSKAGSIIGDILDENGAAKTVKIDSKNLFWDKTGKMEVSAALLMQLVDDLSEIVENVGQLNFKSALVSLKIHPEQQGILKNAIDSKLGPGFYFRLRRANYHTLSSILSILSEVQSHLV